MTAVRNSPQKVLRTGDEVVLSNREPCKIHYLVEKDGQMTFESKVKDLRGALVDVDGSIVETKLRNMYFK